MVGANFHIVDLLAGDLPCFTDALQRRNQRFDLHLSVIPGAANLVGDVFCGAGDHRQMLAELFKVAGCGITYQLKRFCFLVAICQCGGELLGSLDQLARRLPPDGFQFARVLRQKFACHRNFFVNRAHAAFKRFALGT